MIFDLPEVSVVWENISKLLMWDMLYNNRSLYTVLCYGKGAAIGFNVVRESSKLVDAESTKT